MAITADATIINQAVETFIMHEEGFRDRVYKCLGGVKTIGFGTKAKSDDEVITKEEGQHRLRKYLNDITYKKIEKYHIKITNESQLVSIASFDYNTDKLLKIVNSDNTIDCKKILLYNKVKSIKEDGSVEYKVIDNLDKRRHREYELCIK